MAAREAKSVSWQIVITVAMGTMLELAELKIARLLQLCGCRAVACTTPLSGDITSNHYKYARSVAIGMARAMRLETVLKCTELFKTC